MLAKIASLVPPTVEERKQITALQEAKTLCQMVWEVLGIVRYLTRCILEEEISRRNEDCKPDEAIATLVEYGLLPDDIAAKTSVNLAQFYETQKNALSAQFAEAEE